MTDSLKIALAQLNVTMGDLTGNVSRILQARAAAEDADVVIYSELIVCGYPPEDLVLKPYFQDKIEAAVGDLAKATGDGGPAMLIGAPWRDGDRLHNAALLLDGGKVVATRYKHDLPNYDVFDEKRVFAAGPLPGPISYRDVRLGVMVCEDMWTPDVTECLQESGAELLIVLKRIAF